MLLGEFKSINEMYTNDKEIEKLKICLSSFQKNKPILLTGSEGSYVTGLYAKQIMDFTIS